MLALQLLPDIQNRLDALAERTGRSPSDFVQEALLEYLDDLEDLYLAEQRLEDLRSGRSGTVPLGDLLIRYGVEN